MPFNSPTAREVLKYAEEYLGAKPEYLWKNSENAVLRHSGGKWFAALINVKREKLGLTGEGNIEIIDLKCDSVMIGSLLRDKGYYPAYHMNKEHWVTVLLDGTVQSAEIIPLLELSFNLTAVKAVKKTKKK